MVASSGRFYNKGGFIVCSIDIPFFFCGSGEFLNLRKFLFKLSVLLLEKFALFGKPPIRHKPIIKNNTENLIK